MSDSRHSPGAEEGVDRDTVAEPSIPRTLLASIRRDPEHLPERLVLIAHERLAAPSWDWAVDALQREPDSTGEQLGNSLALKAERFARINGAVAGTPFLIAFVPAYLSVLWREAHLAMCIAALSGVDPRSDDFPARLLVLRGVHPDMDTAQAALDGIGASDTRSGESRRGRIRGWVDLVQRVLVLGGFLSGPSADPDSARPGRARQLFGLIAAGAIWAVTWLAPITFMMLMSWSCEKDMRGTAETALDEFGGIERRRERLRLRRRRGEGTRIRPGDLLRGVVAGAGVVIPLGLLVYSVVDPHKDAPIYSVSALAGLVLVMTLWGRAARFD